MTNYFFSFFLIHPTVYPQVESLLNGDAQIPCNISHPQDDTLLMILVYYNPRTKSNRTSSKPIALTGGPPIFSLDLRDLRLHSQYIHRYLHQNKILDKFKRQLKREINVADLNQTTNSPQLLNVHTSRDVNRVTLKRRSRDHLDDKKATELLTSAQFISPTYAGRLAFNFSTNREQFILKLSKLQEQDAGEYVCRADLKWSRTLISVVNLFVIGKWYMHTHTQQIGLICSNLF